MLLLVLALGFVACQQQGQPATNETNSSSNRNDNESVGSLPEPAAAGTEAPDGDEATAASATATPTAVPSPSPTPLPPKALTVCLRTPPQDVYLYGDTSPAATAVRHAVYENLYTSVGYAYQPQGLEKLPSLADGDALVETVTVNAGDAVTAVDGNVVRLVEGVVVENAAGEEVEFTGEPLEMQRMVVDFTFRPLVWSDGTPVTGDDSVFSYETAVNPRTPGRKALVTHTAGYEATGERSVRWTSVPGYLDQTYFFNVWTPLPRHQLEALTADQLVTAPETTRTPLSTGPFVIEEWVEGESITLAANPFYYRADEGLPHLDRLTFRFGDAVAVLSGALAGACDVIADDVLTVDDLPALAETAAYESDTQPGTVFEHIDFGIDPVSDYATERPDWFEDKRVRQAITQCTDRERMRDELTAGIGELMNAYIPESHPLYPDDLQTWPYDPAAGNALLDELGYRDFAGDGRRQDVSSGVPMTVTLGTNSESPVRLRINEIFQENMQQCGIPVVLYDLPAGSWYAEGPRGPLFGRRFDLAQFAWVIRNVPDCGLFLTENITGPEEFDFGGWRNVNVTGFSNEAYDAACRAAQAAMPGGEGYEANHQEALRIFADELPIIPLFTNARVAAVRPSVANVRLETSQPSLLWNVYEWDVSE